MSRFLNLFGNKQKKEKSEDEQKDNPFGDTLVFKRNTLSFPEHTLLLKNITRFRKYTREHKKQVSWVAYMASLIFSLAGLFFFPIGLLATLYFAPIAYKGYSERRIPKLFGLAIELNSGRTYCFSHQDEKGINNLYTTVSDATEMGEPINQTFNFEGDRVEVIKDNIINHGAIKSLIKGVDGNVNFS